MQAARPSLGLSRYVRGVWRLSLLLLRSYVGCCWLVKRQLFVLWCLVLGARMFAVPVLRLWVLYWRFCLAIPQLVRWVSGCENHLAAQVTPR